MSYIELISINTAMKNIGTDWANVPEAYELKDILHRGL